MKQKPRKELKKASVPTIIKWTDWEETYDEVKKGTYFDCQNALGKKDFGIIRNCLYEYFLKNSDFLKKEFFNGSYHQNMPNGVPIIKYKGHTYAYLVSTRRWGDLIAQVMANLDGKQYQSVYEFWEKVKKKKKGKKVKKRDPYSYYNYLDFSWSWGDAERKAKEKL
jgi:hypothetical protein